MSADYIVLVGCGSKKAREPRRAIDLYIGRLFLLRVAYAQKFYPGARLYILSAKYGLLEPDKVVAPYDETLKKWPIARRRAWAKKVLRQLRSKVGALSGHVFVVMAGKEYYQFLLPLLPNHILVPAPRYDFRVAKQIKWFKEAVYGR